MLAEETSVLLVFTFRGHFWNTRDISGNWESAKVLPIVKKDKERLTQ